mmetsp:Transcript_35569/g.62833  ORF Transcript_35569/g.62833 Transcript_35569/m.62833 type:complete len:206 (-) Transcript_35569:33-650(-)
MHIFSQADAQQTSPPPPLKRLKPWLILLLTVQAVLVGLRVWLGDLHGSLLMFSVALVGVVAVLFDDVEDASYCRYYGVMSFVSGMLDLSISVEMLGRRPWRHHKSHDKHLMEALVPLLVHSVCAVSQLCSAAMCYSLCRDLDDDAEVQASIWATEDQVQVYGAAMYHSQWQGRVGTGEEQPVSAAGLQPGPPGVKPFAGAAHKLP